MSTASLVGGARMPSGATRTSFGKQKLSRTASAPSFGFGAATRDVASKVFVNQEHTSLAMAGTQSPGPVYGLPASVGKQPDGRRRDPPTWSFGSNARFRSGGDADEPAPNRYDVTRSTSIGDRQTLSRQPSEPRFGFGTASRQQAQDGHLGRDQVKLAFGKESPGPLVSSVVDVPVGAIGKQVRSKFGTGPRYSLSSRAMAPDEDKASPGPIYMLPQSVGPQPESTVKRGTTSKFGTSTREIQAKVFLGKEQSAADHGKHTPGPAADYAVYGSIGRQVSSKNASRPSSAFSRASRWGHYERERRARSTPGPGAYND